MTILIKPHGEARIIDVLSLKESTFTAVSNDGKSLKSILEDPNIPKCFWDVRNDADALWALYQVSLAGVVDIQVLENASRVGDKTYLLGLDKAIQSDVNLSSTQCSNWIRSKREIKSMMSADVFAIRPIEVKVAQYCTNDVSYLPELRDRYLRRISKDWLEKATAESSRRVDEAQSPTYEPHAPAKAKGPWGSGNGESALSLEDILEKWEEQRIDDLARDLFGVDEDDEYYDEGPTSCRDIIDDWDYCLYYSD